MKTIRRIHYALCVLAVFAACMRSPHLAAAADTNQTSTDGDASCRYDRAKLLAMGYQAFDQTPGNGWRELAAGDKCLVQAADLIRDYRTVNNTPNPMLYWHEGQLRALNGSVIEAI
jgi:hypothetical protein